MRVFANKSSYLQNLTVKNSLLCRSDLEILSNPYPGLSVPNLLCLGLLDAYSRDILEPCGHCLLSRLINLFGFEEIVLETTSEEMTQGFELLHL